MDLQYIQFSDALSVTGASEIPDLVPRSLQIRGMDFRHAIKVYMNDLLSPSFVVSSNTIILAQVPTPLVKSNIQTIEVISSEFTATWQSKLIFEIGDNPKLITGLQVMMQTFLKVLFTTPGSDSFVGRLGGNALKNLGGSFEVSETSSVVSDFTIAVSRTVTQIQGLQAQQTQIPDDERLLAANVLGVSFNPYLTALVARVELIAQSGKRAIVNLEL